MSNPKVATPIVDKNGKQTTVHRKIDAASESTRTLPSVTPSVDEIYIPDINPEHLRLLSETFEITSFTENGEYDSSLAEFVTLTGEEWVVFDEDGIRDALIEDIEDHKAGYVPTGLLAESTGVIASAFDAIINFQGSEASQQEVLSIIEHTKGVKELVDEIMFAPNFTGDWFGTYDGVETEFITDDGALYLYRRN